LLLVVGYVNRLQKVALIFALIIGLLGILFMIIVFSSVSEQLETELLSQVSILISLHKFATVSSIFSSTGGIIATDSFLYMITLSFDDFIQNLFTSYLAEMFSYSNN